MSVLTCGLVLWCEQMHRAYQPLEFDKDLAAAALCLLAVLVVLSCKDYNENVQPLRSSNVLCHLFVKYAAAFHDSGPCRGQGKMARAMADDR